MVKEMLLTAGVCAVVTFGAVGSKDTVTTDPVLPTTKDSITFSLFNYDICCCAAYGNKILTSTDTSVTLAYAFDDQPCLACMCLMAGSTVSYKSGRLKAGTYRIYKLEDVCRLGAQICPAMMAMPVLVGRVTVRGATVARSPVVAHPATVVSAVMRAPAVDMRGRVVEGRLEAGDGIRFVGSKLGGELRVNLVN